MKIPTTKSLKIHLSKLKYPKPNCSSSSHSSLAGCIFLKTKSFTVDPNQCKVNGQGESPMDITMVESTKFLNVPKKLHATHRFFVQISETSSVAEEKQGRAPNTHADNSTCTSPVRASKAPVTEARRSEWEFEGPGESLTRTNSLVEGRESNTSGDSSTNEAMTTAWPFEEPCPWTRVSLPGESVALGTYSIEPYADFRQSILDMVESRIERNLAVDWNYMEKLVRCYLELNDQKNHDCIWSAFDVVVLEVVAYQRLQTQHSI